MGLLKPKWQSKNIDKAVKAVGNLTDQAEITRAAREADNWPVRKAAIQRLTDQQVLADIAEHGSDLRVTAAERITDPTLLAHLAQVPGDFCVRATAVEKIEDQTLLLHIATTDATESVCKKALSKIKDQSAFADIVLNHPSLTIRQCAVDYISDKRLLSSIFAQADDLYLMDLISQKTGDSKQIALVAARKEEIQQDRLYQTIITSKNQAERCEAARKYQDTDKLVEIVKGTNDRWIAYDVLAAISKRLDQAMIEDIYVHAQDAYVRRSVAVDSNDKVFLRKVALNDPAGHVRLQAANKLADQDVYYQIYLTEEDQSVRAACIEAIENEEKLQSILRSPKDIGCFIAAAKKNPQLAGIADSLAVVVQEPVSERRWLPAVAEIERVAQEQPGLLRPIGKQLKPIIENKTEQELNEYGSGDDTFYMPGELRHIGRPFPYYE